MFKNLSPGAIGIRGLSLAEQIELAAKSGFGGIDFSVREAADLASDPEFASYLRMRADALQTDDHRVFETGEPSFQHEYVDKSSRGKATLNVCKWLGELDGEKRCFGISFTIE